MDKTKRLSRVFLFVVCTLALVVTPLAATVDQTAETAGVKKAVDDFFSAVKKRDWDAAAASMSADFELYTDGAAAYSKDAYVKVLKEDNMEVVSMELKDMDVRVAGDLAWCKYHGLFKFKSQDGVSTVETVETLIFKKQGAQWKMTHAHVSLKTATP